jgi:surface antigen
MILATTIGVISQEALRPNVVSAASTGDDYPWSNATCVTPNPNLKTPACAGGVAYDNWGYAKTCPSNDEGCMGLNGTLKGVKYGEMDPWGMYLRNCTSAVAWWLSERNGYQIPFHDDASGWGADAKARNIPVNMMPAPGAVAWWKASDHVAWVKSVSADGKSVTIEEYNQNFDGTYSSRTIPTASVDGYIHFKDLPSPSQSPAVIQRSATGETDIVSTGPDGSLNYYFNAAGSSAWGHLIVAPAGSASGSPAVIQRSATGETDIVSTGPDGSLNYYFNAAGSSAWGHLIVAPAGSASGSPAVIQRSATGETDIVSTGPDGSLNYYFNAAGSSAWGHLIA